MNHRYHNCLLESSHLENPSVLMGWQTGIGMVSTCEKTTWKIAPVGTILQLYQGKGSHTGKSGETARN